MSKKRRRSKRTGDGAKMIKSSPEPSGDGSENLPTTSLKLKPEPEVFLASELAKARDYSQPIQIAPESQYAEAPSVNLKFKDTIRVINKMVEAGIIGRYA